MTKDPKDHLFKFQMPLNNEIYQYKFIIDGNWRCSNHFPTKDDGNGNINNILDNTKNVLVKPKDNQIDEKEEKKEKSKKTKKIKNKVKCLPKLKLLKPEHLRLTKKN